MKDLYIIWNVANNFQSGRGGEHSVEGDDANVYEWLQSEIQELYQSLCATPEDFIGVTLSSERFVHDLHGFHLDAWVIYLLTIYGINLQAWHRALTILKLTIHC